MVNDNNSFCIYLEILFADDKFIPLMIHLNHKKNYIYLFDFFF